ncbi:MAG: phytanoyl-CoA dioxygenase family protein [Chitinophagaceae bacterium]|nr:MAG: phytanoyl-CoA dioxygenase family protein [Chitinophagaceae bacterium]
MSHAEIKRNYDRDGYVFIKSFLREEEVEQINRELKSFISKEVKSMPAAFVFYEDNSDPATLKQLQDIHRYNSFFERILKGSEFEKIAELLLEDKVIGKNLEYFNKPPQIGKPTPPHQDGYYFMLNPPQAITMWMALEDADEENGCVRYIPGSHKKGMRLHGRTKTLGFSQGITDYGKQDFAAEIPFPAQAGDLLIHHAMTVHRADGNKSNRSRRALGFIYFGESAREDLEAKKAYQQKLNEERLAG